MFASSKAQQQKKAGKHSLNSDVFNARQGAQASFLSLSFVTNGLRACLRNIPFDILCCRREHSFLSPFVQTLFCVQPNGIVTCTNQQRAIRFLKLV
jgi:hypothetical protein